MKKRLLLVVLTFVAFAVVSCNREEPTPDNPSNSDEFDTYQKIEAYCLDNGWSECSLYVPNGGYSYDNFSDPQNCFWLHYAEDGTLRGFGSMGVSDNNASYRLYSSFSTLLSINTIPTDGYLQYFTCDNEKFGICRYVEYNYNTNPSQYLLDTETSGYSKFYIRRINDHKIKILYKKCDWPIVE
jgi:hypothetical protein